MNVDATIQKCMGGGDTTQCQAFEMILNTLKACSFIADLIPQLENVRSSKFSPSYENL